MDAVTAPASGYHDEQQAAEEALAADSVDLEPHRYMLRRGRWVQIDNGPSIDNYQPKDHT